MRTDMSKFAKKIAQMLKWGPICARPKTNKFAQVSTHFCGFLMWKSQVEQILFIKYVGIYTFKKQHLKMQSFT